MPRGLAGRGRHVGLGGRLGLDPGREPCRCGDRTSGHDSRVDREPEADDESGDDVFEFAMTFAAEQCPECGTLAEPDTCPACGAEIPSTAEVNPETSARRSAVGPLLEEAEHILSRFDDIPPGVIPVSLGQFATAITDGDLYGLAGRLVGMGKELCGFDLNNRDTIGTTLRAAVVQRLATTSELLAVCEELGAMAPEAPGAEARDLAIEGARYAADMLVTYVRLITSASITEARRNESAMNRLLEGFPPGDRMSALLEEVGVLPFDDIDERVGRVLQQSGTYTDELGLLDLSLVFGAFADLEQPMLALAERTRAYFAHLLPSAAPDPGLAFLLAIPAVTVGVLDRPLVAHRCARLMCSLSEQALGVDRAATIDQVERISEPGAIILGSLALNVGEVRGVAAA